MRILLDENVTLALAGVLRDKGHDVIAIAELSERGTGDERVGKLACNRQCLLITRDYHFTNGLRFDPTRCLGIIFIRHGNLTAQEELSLVARFIERYPLSVYRGKLVRLNKAEARLL